MHDAPVEAHEQAEQAHHAAHDSSPFLSRVTITIAALAVLAAGAGSLETLESGAAIIAANAAVLDQDRATDSWNLYQARSIKKYMLDIAADGEAETGAAVSAAAPPGDYRAKARTEGAGETDALNMAKRQEAQRDRDLGASEIHERRHHWLTIAATLIEIGIALSTVAIITRRFWPWLSAIALGTAGAALTAVAYFVAA